MMFLIERKFCRDVRVLGTVKKGVAELPLRSDAVAHALIIVRS